MKRIEWVKRIEKEGVGKVYNFYQFNLMFVNN